MRIQKLFLIIIVGFLNLCPLFNQVNADFTANVTSGCNTLQVSFSDLSSSTAGTITSWEWELGGVSSTNQNPGRVFGTPGFYTICLTIMDSEGSTDTECKTSFIEVYNLPDPAFTSNDQFGCAPSEIIFFDESNSIDGNIVEWVWGLGGTSGVVIDAGTLQEISSVYQNPDAYTISLTVTDDNECVNTITEEDYITIFDFPVIDISISDTFDCSAPHFSTITNNNIEPNVNYSWDLGNGNPIFEGPAPPTAVYLNEGSFDITVIAQNTLTSCADTVVFENAIIVGNQVQFIHSPVEVCEGGTVSFSNTSVVGVTNPQWDFGDGEFSTAISPNHVYDEPGCYFATLSGTINGCVDTYITTECIEIFPLPNVSFDFLNPDGCELPHTVNFNGISNTAETFSWDFGDGETSDLEDPFHIYTEFGIYPVTLEVTDQNGCMSTFLDTVQLIELEASMNVDLIFGCNPLSFNLSENSTTVSPINSWQWLIDTSFSDSNSPLFSSTDATPSFTIADTGWFDITLIVTNTLGCVDTIINQGAVGIGNVPDINFIASPLVACVDESIQFTDLSSDFGDDWFWDFGDGTTSFEQNPIYSYTTPDTFDVSLTVGHNGCFNNSTFTQYIIVQEPQASFSLDRDCSTPFEVGFINSAIGADSVFWDFGYLGDTDTSSQLNPVFTYPETGCFVATQIAFNFSTACIDTFQMELCITEPDAIFTLAPLTGCAPLNVSVTNNSMFDVAWEWSAPGGTISNATIENPIITYSNPGIYSDVQLIVTDMNNCQDVIVFTDSIIVDGVTPDFQSLPSGGCIPLDVQFLDASSTFLSPIVFWEWNINNGALITNDQNTSFFFDQLGTYPVSLTVTNDWGCTGTINMSDAVSVTMPIASFTTDSISCPADTIEFNNTSVGENLNSVWSFGDGLFSTEPSPTHQFQNPGIYEVCLTITDFASCDQTFCQNIEIVMPIADFTSDTTFANCPPLIVSFENESQNAISYEWDFGDNSGLSDLENPQHIYTIPGSYDVTLIVELNESCRDTLLIENMIEIEGPIGAFSFDKDTACVPDIVTFGGASDDFFTYIWDFGDGVVDTTFNVMSDTVTHAYLQAGKYVPKLILIDAVNCQRTLESPDTITIGLLEIDFTATDTTLCEGVDETTFINLINSSEPISDLLWIFENGNPGSSTAFEPTVSFPTQGVYDVSLIVENVYCRDTLVKEDYIGAGALPVADFVMANDVGCVPLDVQFTDQSSSADGTLVAWDWDFGDGNSSTELNPNHEYNLEGDIEVSLTVTTEYNCSDTATQIVTTNAAAYASIFTSESEICIGDVVNLTAVVIDPLDTIGLEYNWLPDPTLSCLDCFSTIANPIVSTTYYFVSTTSFGCVDTTSISINVLPFEIPDISLTSDTTLCLNESFQLEVQSEGMVVYEWDDSSDSISCLDCNNPIVNPIESTVYTVTVTNSFGCDDVDSVTIDVIDQTQLLLGEDRTICEGDSVQIQVLVDGEVSWLNISSLSCSDCIDPLAYPSETTVYPFQLITADFSCEFMDTIVVNVFGEDDIDAGENLKICLGETIILEGFTNSPGTVLWTPSTELDNDTLLNPIANPTDTITYFLNIEEDQCILSDSVEIVVQYETLVESFNYEICEGDTVQIEYFGEADMVEWSPVDGLSDELADSPLAFPEQTTQYLLTASLSTCLEDTATATIVVNQAPGIDDFIAYDKFPGQDVQIELIVETGSGDYSYDWLRYDGLSCNNCADPVLSIDTSGFYHVIITDEANGCETEVMVFINLLKGCSSDLIGVPNIFTPNDDGYNDKLEIFGGPIIEIYTFKVYSRWGALVYETSDINAGWDGFYKNELMPSGVYVYFLQAPCVIDDSVILKKGDFVLKR